MMKSAPPEVMALSHRYWRWLRYCLSTYANPIGLPGIARHLTVWERWDDLPQNRLAVYTALYHDHLPALSDADFVTYHQQDDEGELGRATARIKSALQRRIEREANALLAAGGEVVNAYDATSE